MIYSIKFGKMKVFLRSEAIADYWVFEGLLFADEYYPVRPTKDDIVLDVGANIGIFTLNVAKRVKNVISIEPEPRNFSILSKNITDNDLSNVTLLNLAASDKEEIVYFQSTGGTAQVSNTGIPVKGKPLDSILAELGNPKVTIMKMDIEGYESKVLSTFHKYDSIKQIVIETHSKKLTEEVTNILSKWGFSIVDISRIKRSRAIKNILLHPFAFFSAERHNRYATLKQTFKYLIFHDYSPVASDNPNSEQRLLYAVRQK